jgi:GNAT superfamily N-acetyltransferase
MDNYHLRYGIANDKDWLYALYCKTMKPCIEATWGWDKQFQIEGFKNNLAPIYWQIINDGRDDLGGFVLKEKPDHLWLEMIIIDPVHQKRGIGRTLLTFIKECAIEKQLPLRLSVIKANPVVPFYQKLGFRQYDEDDAFYKLEWHSMLEINNV